MGNSCSCCTSSSGLNKSTPKLDSIMHTIADQDKAQQLDTLIDFIEVLLKKMEGVAEEEAPTVNRVESVASITRLAAQAIDMIKTEVGNLKDSELAKVLGSTTLKAMKLVGESHWIFLGLSVVAYALETYVQIKSNVKRSMELLGDIVELAKDLKKFERATQGESEKVNKAVQVIVEGAVMCCDYMTKGDASRYWSGVDAQIQKTKDSMKDIRSSLALAGVTYIARLITRRSEQSSHHLLDFEPVGIEEKVLELKKMLDMEGDEPALALVLCGLPGVGKSTLAASLIQQVDLELNSTAFRFCRVMINQETADKASHVMQLQRDIIYEFGGLKWNLRNPEEGRKCLREVMENKSCLLYIDNVDDIDYVKQLLPQKLSVAKQSLNKTDSVKKKKQMTKLRILITSRQGNLKRVLWHINTYREYHVDTLSADAAKMLLRRKILNGESFKLQNEFDEEGLIVEVAEACKGFPRLLSRVGNDLKDARDQITYEDTLETLRQGNFREQLR